MLKKTHLVLGLLTLLVPGMFLFLAGRKLILVESNIPT